MTKNKGKVITVRKCRMFCSKSWKFNLRDRNSDRDPTYYIPEVDVKVVDNFHSHLSKKHKFAHLAAESVVSNGILMRSVFFLHIHPGFKLIIQASTVIWVVSTEFYYLLLSAATYSTKFHVLWSENRLWNRCEVGWIDNMKSSGLNHNIWIDKLFNIYESVC